VIGSKAAVPIGPPPTASAKADGNAMAEKTKCQTWTKLHNVGGDRDIMCWLVPRETHHVTPRMWCSGSVREHPRQPFAPKQRHMRAVPEIEGSPCAARSKSCEKISQPSRLCRLQSDASSVVLTLFLTPSVVPPCRLNRVAGTLDPPSFQRLVVNTVLLFQRKTFPQWSLRF